MARRRVVRALLPELPVWIGPVEFSPFDAKWTAARCPYDLDPMMRKAGGLWEAGSRRWPIPRGRLGPLIRNLRRATDPLFRRAGMSLDQEGSR
jgi:hypothetical protein